MHVELELAVWAVENVPAGQDEQAEPAADHIPPPQGVQVVEPATLEYPVGHDRHTEIDEAATAVEYFPAGHC